MERALKAQREAHERSAKELERARAEAEASQAASRCVPALARGHYT